MLIFTRAKLRGQTLSTCYDLPLESRGRLIQEERRPVSCLVPESTSLFSCGASLCSCGSRSSSGGILVPNEVCLSFCQPMGSLWGRSTVCSKCTESQSGASSQLATVPVVEVAYSITGTLVVLPQRWNESSCLTQVLAQAEALIWNTSTCLLGCARLLGLLTLGRLLALGGLGTPRGFASFCDAYFATSSTGPLLGGRPTLFEALALHHGVSVIVVVSRESCESGVVLLVDIGMHDTETKQQNIGTMSVG